VALAAAIAVSTVASTASAASKPQAGKYGGDAKVAIADTFPGFCVSNNPNNSALMAVRTIYETLVEKSVGGDYIPLLAKSWSASSDLKSWTFTLREGVKFHDGTAFNADSVITNFNYITGRVALAAFAAGGLAGYARAGYTVGTGSTFSANISKMTKVSDFVVKFDLDRAQNDFPGTLYASGRFVMRAPSQLADKDKCLKNPSGTGPFKVESSYTLINQDELKVVRNPEYWRTAANGDKLPYLDSITFTNVKEGSQRAAAVRKGTYDAGQFGSATRPRTARRSPTRTPVSRCCTASTVSTTRRSAPRVRPPSQGHWSSRQTRCTRRVASRSSTRPRPRSTQPRTRPRPART
jgi:ABC-type transport system substrate-binding protein